MEWLFKLYSLGLIRDMIDGKGMIKAVWKSTSSGKDAVDLAMFKVLLSRFDHQWWKFQMGLNVMGKLEWINGYNIEWILIS